MASTRLHVDATAPAVPMKAASKAEAALMETGPAAQTQLASSAAVGSTNTFDVAAASVATWARGAHNAATTAARTRSTAVGAVSVSGFAKLSGMNAGNAVDLAKVGR